MVMVDISGDRGSMGRLGQQAAGELAAGCGWRLDGEREKWDELTHGAVDSKQAGRE
jgi:hypothetical protein